MFLRCSDAQGIITQSATTLSTHMHPTCPEVYLKAGLAAKPASLYPQPDFPTALEDKEKTYIGHDGCRIRRIKCDEQRPFCMKCVSTGRKCDGYMPLPHTYYTWDELLRPPKFPTPGLPGYENVEMRGFAFYREVVVPSLSLSTSTSFWMHHVLQVAEHEPAVRYAVLAISSLYENFDARPAIFNAFDSSWQQPKRAENQVAMQNYNAAIRTVVASTMDLNTILLVSVLFTCIEFLRGNAKSAILHCRYGIQVCNSHSQGTELSAIFHHLSIFPFFFGRETSDFPTLGKINAPDEEYVLSSSDTTRASELLDSLVAKSARLIRMINETRSRPTESPEAMAKLEEDQRDLTQALRIWSMRMSDFVTNSPDPFFENSTVYRLFLTRWRICKIWLATCLYTDETKYDGCGEDFEHIIQLAHVEELERLKQNGPGSAKFTFEMRFGPLLYFVAIKCRDLQLRLEALRLLATLSCNREVLWDAEVMHATASRIIQLEHGLESLDAPGFVGEKKTLPRPEQRIIDSIMERDTRNHMGADGVPVTQRKILFVTVMPGAGCRVVTDWININV